MVHEGGQAPLSAAGAQHKHLQEEHSEEKEIHLQLSGLRTGKGNLRGLESPGMITGEGGKAPLKVVCEILSSPQTVQGLTLNSVQKPEN